MNDNHTFRGIVPAEPGTYYLGKDEGHLFRCGPIIAWLFHTYRRNGQVAPGGKREICFADPLCSEGDIPFNDYAILYPDGRVAFPYDNNFDSLGEAKLYVLEQHLENQARAK